MHRIPFAAVLAAFVSTACEHSYKKPGTTDAAPEATAAPAPKAEELALVRADALALIDEPFCTSTIAEAISYSTRRTAGEGTISGSPSRFTATSGT